MKTAYEKIVTNIIRKEIRGLIKDMGLGLSLLIIDLILEPLDYGYVEFKATFKIKGKSLKVDGIIDCYGKVSFSELRGLKTC